MRRILLLSLLLVACGKKREDGPLDVQIGAQRNTWSQCFIVHQKLLGSNHSIDLTCMKDGKEDLNVLVMTPASSLAETVGKPMQLDFEKDNPGLEYAEIVQTHFSLGGKRYQGHKLTLTVQSADDKEAKGTVSGTFLEFAREDDDKPGSPVQVSFNFALPIKRVD